MDLVDYWKKKKRRRRRGEGGEVWRWVCGKVQEKFEGEMTDDGYDQITHTLKILKGLKTKKKCQLTGHLAKEKDMLALEAFDICISFVPLSHVVLLPFLQDKDIEAHTN